jgi:chromosome segregation ATPase
VGNLDRLYDQRPEQASFKTRAIERVEAAPAVATTSCGLALDLVYQVAEMIKSIEHQAGEAESDLRSSLQLAQRRIQELETELRSERLHLEAAEREMCELEMRVRTAEAKAKEHSNAMAQVTEAIRTQLLENRTPSKKFKLPASG